MRRRVASTAAIVSLVCCLIFTLIYHQAVHDSLRADQVSDLLRLCRVSAEYVDAAALYASGDIDFREIIKVNSDFNIGAAVYDSEQNELVITPRYSLVGALSDQEDYVQALTEGYGTAITGPAGAKMIHVSVLTESGLLVRMNERVNEGAIITGSRARFMFLVALCTLLLCYVSVYLLSRKNDRFTDSTKYLLDAFAEGRFDARLKGVHGHHAHVAEVINSYADRIQKQVGRQSARNQAVSALMNQMQNGVLAVNASLEVMLMTPVARQLFGVHEPPEGKPVADICPEANLDHIFRESIGQPGVYTQELAVREGRTGRSVTPVKLYISPILQDGRSIGSVALVEDETEIRRLEQARNNFTANVSHELKTPLTSIRGFVETLLDGAIDQPEMARKFLNIIMMEANRLTRLVNDILSISKLESGDTEVSNGRLQLDKMAHDVCEMLQPNAAERKVTLTINDNPAPIYIWGNEDRTEQLIINLTENAIKYNKEGGSVRVAVTENRERDKVYFLVSDTGIGIAEEHIPRLFERFYRVDKGRSRAMGGTGLGLAIVKHIAVSMGGDIEVHSKLGEGSEFLVTLPRYSAEKAAEYSQKRAEASDT